MNELPCTKVGIVYYILDFIDAGVSKEFMIREWKQAKAETVTPNCRQRCSGCGAKRYGGGVCHEGQN